MGKNANRIHHFPTQQRRGAAKQTKPSPKGLGFWFGGEWMVRFEPIAVQHAGGMLLPPVQKLAATIIAVAFVFSLWYNQLYKLEFDEVICYEEGT